MHLDVRELRTFYYRSFLGRSVQATIREQVLRLWPQARHEAVLGYGCLLYTSPSPRDKRQSRMPSSA